MDFKSLVLTACCSLFVLTATFGQLTQDDIILLQKQQTELSKAEDFQLFAIDDNIVTVKFYTPTTTPRQVWLCDWNGRMITQISTTKEIVELPYSGVASGVYLVSVWTKEGVVTKQVFLWR